MFSLLNSLLLAVVFTWPTFSEAKIQYTNNKKPYLVVLTATWCAPCQTYKNLIVKPMYLNGELKDVNLAVIDVDKARQDKELKQVVEFIVKDINNFSIPQTALIYKTDSGWKIRSQKGMLSKQQLLKLIEAKNAK